MTFGEKLKELRINKKYSIQMLAEKTGISESMLRYYEKDGASPSFGNVINITKTLGVDVRSLIDDTSTFVYESIVKKINEVDVSKLDFMELKNYEYDLNLILEFILTKYKLKEWD